MADAVVMHLASRLRDDVPVVFLDTGYHFAETMGMADAVEAVYPVKLHRMLPLLTVAEQDAEYGKPACIDRDPDACCRMRKVEPLERGARRLRRLGVRRPPRRDRRRAPTPGVVEWDAKRSMVKVNPIAAWTEADVDAYIAEHGVLVNPLLTDGYSSVGCAPCTRRIAAGEDARAGRWAGRARSSAVCTSDRARPQVWLACAYAHSDAPGTMLTQRRHVDLKMVASAVCRAR